MSLIASLKEKLAASVNKISGNTDFLEAVCAAAALTASADGDISDKEIETTGKVIASNPTLVKAFKVKDIERISDAMLKRAQAGRTGRNGLYKEIEQVSASHEMAETVYLCALDVAEASGDVDTKEREVLNTIAQRLSLNPSNYNV